MLGDASSPSSPTERDAEYPARRTGDGPSPNAAGEQLDRSDPSDLMGTSTSCREPNPATPVLPFKPAYYVIRTSQNSGHVVKTER